jgi:hypothetical protein
MINKVFLTLFVGALLALGGCAQLIDNLAEQDMPGTWHLQSIKDNKTGQETAVSSLSISTRILGNLQGNAVQFGDIGGGFNVFYQLEGDNGVQDGTYDVDLLTLELKLNNGITLKRQINSVDDNQLILADTINGVAKTLNFLRI